MQKGPNYTCRCQKPLYTKFSSFCGLFSLVRTVMHWQTARNQFPPLPNWERTDSIGSWSKLMNPELPFSDNINWGELMEATCCFWPTQFAFSAIWLLARWNCGISFQDLIPNLFDVGLHCRITVLSIPNFDFKKVFPWLWNGRSNVHLKATTEETQFHQGFFCCESHQGWWI